VTKIFPRRTLLHPTEIAEEIAQPVKVINNGEKKQIGKLANYETDRKQLSAEPEN
jgi:hypothetical protein